MGAQPQAPRLGLALSGGGHRAAFFHIGVLAKLSELGLLRKVEVVSTVSGGSIVGALYYLHLKKRFDSAADGELDDADYFAVVRAVLRDYYGGATKNLRARVLLSPLANLKYAFPNYTRTDRMGELYEHHFYRGAWGNGPRRHGRIAMADLKIFPGGDETFSPTRDNGARRSKVPILLLNATTLNTGHNWRFAAQYMGEPRADEAAESDVDKNIRLRLTEWGSFPITRPRFGPSLFAIDYNAFPLGAAVASSACFPIGFPPKALPRLFARTVDGEEVPMTVQLVDGGVHDNQGIEGLTDLDREHHACTHVIISDASGQMPDLDKPSGRIPKLLPRLISVEGDVQREQRVLRTVEAGHAADAATPGEPAGRVAFMHLQTGLDAVAISPAGVPDGDAERERMSPAHTGVPPRAQRLLARVRTDLDAFSEVEALSLMLDGYRLAGSTIAMEPGIAALAGDGVPGRPDVGWRFEDVAADLDALPEPYLRRLRIAEQRFLKPLRLVLAGLTKRRKQTMSESAHRLTRRRWTVRAAGIAWLAVLGGLVFAGVVLADSDVSAAALYASLVGLMAGLFLYASPDTPGLHYVSRLLFSVLAPLVAWPFLPLLAGLQLLGGWLHLRAGRVPERKAARRERAPEARRAAVER